MVEWQTKVLGVTLSGLSMSEKGAAALRKYIESVQLFPDGGLDSALVQPSARNKPLATLTEDEITDIVEGRTTSVDPRSGSYEQMMGMLGMGGFQPPRG